ncbi:unnamed protein product, partial [Urochloa humidicola]
IVLLLQACRIQRTTNSELKTEDRVVNTFQLHAKNNTESLHHLQI